MDAPSVQFRADSGHHDFDVRQVHSVQFGATASDFDELEAEGAGSAEAEVRVGRRLVFSPDAAAEFPVAGSA